MLPGVFFFRLDCWLGLDSTSALLYVGRLQGCNEIHLTRQALEFPGGPGTNRLLKLVREKSAHEQDRPAPFQQSVTN